MPERIADYIIRTVNQVGADHIFMLTGRGILYLTDAVAKNQNVEAIPSYHEQGASYAAMAYAAARNGIAVCLVSTGCAATNAVTAVLCAYQDNLPVVFISGQNMLHETIRYTGMPIRTFGSQEADIVSIVQPVTKYAVMLTEPQKTVCEVEKALYFAEEGRKGPVWIDIPLDIQNTRIEPEKQEHFIPPLKHNDTALAAEIDVVVDEISRAQRPVVLIGGGVASAGAEKELKEFVECCSMPLAFSPTASDIYGTSHELSIGAVGSIGGTRAGNFAIQNSDYVLAIGTKLCSQETGMKHAFARHAHITVVDIDEDEHKKSGVHIEHFIHADARDFISRILAKEVKPTSDLWIDRCKHWKTVFSIAHELFIKELKEKNELDIYSLADMLSDVLPEKATVITDAGFEELIVPSAIRFKDGQRCLFPASQGAMGYAIPAIVGAHYAGRKKIVCIVGDGSFMMNIQELQIIRAHQIPVKIIVINNDMYAVIRKRQKDLFRTRTICNDPSDGLPAPDFKSIADCFGLSYRKIESQSDLEDNFASILESDEQILCEILCTPDQKYLHESYAVDQKKRLVHRPIEDMAPFLDRTIIEAEMIVDMME